MQNEEERRRSLTCAHVWWAGWHCNRHGDTPEATQCGVDGCFEDGCFYSVCSSCHKRLLHRLEDFEVRTLLPGKVLPSEILPPEENGTE